MDIIRPDWPAPPAVRAVSTTRDGGVSAGPFASLNLGDHVGDEPDRVARNRALLRERLRLSAEPQWLRQVHGCGVADADGASALCEADASVARSPGRVCAVMTADCLPILLCDEAGTRVAAVHAGWRGLAAGVVDGAVTALGASPSALLAWLGPAIGPDAFEVGAEVRERFVANDPGNESAFRELNGGKWLADIYRLARRRLARLGVARVFGGGHCTASEPERFFSYRRDGVTGRMGSMIWLVPGHGPESRGDDHV